MRVVLFIGFALSAALGFLTLIVSKSPISEIQALILFLIAAVLNTAKEASEDRARPQIGHN